MLKNLIILPDGTELFSGKGTKNAVMSATLTECVNSGEELTLGSTCANMLEATIWTRGGSLSLTAGDELTLYKVDDAGTRHKVGIFAIEKPTKTSTNTMKITGYDRVSKLDKDLTTWLKALTGWPYTLLTFAQMVCAACGVSLTTETIPNANFPVNQFSKPEVTGRQLMQWIGEVCARFCRANTDGEIEYAWYVPSGVTISPSGADHFYVGGLSYEDYQVAPVEAVQLRLADSENGYLWPAVENGANSYIITGNPLFMAAITEDTLPYLEVIQAELAGQSYTPCKVSLPARFDVRAGHTVEVSDSNGVTFTAYVMTKKQKGQRDTIESTGSARRDSSTAQNNKSGSALEEEQDIQLTQEEVFEILTNGGEIEGLFMKDGQLYVNASYIFTGTLDASKVTIDNLSADRIVSGIMSAKDSVSRFDLDNGTIHVGRKASDGTVTELYFVRNHLFVRQVALDGTETEFFDLYADGTGTWMESAAQLRLLADGPIYIGKNLNYTPVTIQGTDISIYPHGVFTLGSIDCTEAKVMADMITLAGTVTIQGKTASWKDNGDGTYTLIGT